MMSLKMTYGPEVDALYIQLQDGPIKDRVDYEEGVTLDLDEDGNPIGLEILDVRDHLDRESDWTLLAPRHAEAR